MTYPVPEETSSSVMLMVGNLYGTIFIALFGVAVGKGYHKLIKIIIGGINVASVILACIGKTEEKRGRAEILAQNMNDNKDW